MTGIEPGRPVRDMNIGPDSTVPEIFSEMAGAGGFEATALSDGFDILSEMIPDPDCLRFVSFVGAVISTGLRGVVKAMMRDGWFDVCVTTCGALDHDISRHFSEYMEGSFTMDDKTLADMDMHRLGNVLVPMSNYGPLIEDRIRPMLQAEYDRGVRRMSPSDVARVVGSNLGEDSFLHWAAKNDIPVLVPGIMDGAVGSQVWMFAQNHPDFEMDMISDANLLSGLVFKAKRSGALMIGGGISKHHTLWWNQYRGGLDYAVYVTTAQEFDGSLSGAPVREAISWGKVTRGARQTTIHAEATMILPFIHAGLRARLGA